MARRTRPHAIGCVRTPSASSAVNTPAGCWILSQTVLVWTTWPTHCPRSALRNGWRRNDNRQSRRRSPCSSRLQPRRNGVVHLLQPDELELVAHFLGDVVVVALVARR